jgi:hypothetical protein
MARSTMIRRGPKLLPADAELPADIAAGPVLSLWAEWEGPGRPVIVDPLARLQDARRRWSAAGQAWSVGLGCSRNAWIAKLPQDVLALVSPAGIERAEQIARQRVTPMR